MRRPHLYLPHERPDWWPESEPWPPPRARRWPRGNRRWLWLPVAWLALVFAFSLGACTLVFWLAAQAIGLINLPASAVELARAFSVGALLLAVAGVALSVRGLRNVALPLGELAQAAERVAEGDYAVRVTEGGAGGLRNLTHAFNAMAARLQSGDEQRRNLLADISHELRTPVTVIQGNLEGLLDGVYPRDDAHLARALDELRVLVRLIEDLRTLALAESGGLALQREPCDLALLAGETAAAFRAQADAAGVTLEVEAPDEPVVLDLDPERMREVITNLLANALRFTPSGGRVRVTCAATAEQVTLAVSDTGRGIPVEDLPHVFDRYYKAADSHGMGLGLPIVRGLVAAHGGTVAVESAGGSGSTFKVMLPRGRTGEPVSG
jgi:two-component system sensor histidine kinase BaeS